MPSDKRPAKRSKSSESESESESDEVPTWSGWSDDANVKLATLVLKDPAFDDTKLKFDWAQMTIEFNEWAKSVGEPERSREALQAYANCRPEAPLTGLSRAIGAKLFATGSVDKERERDHAEQIGIVGMDGSASFVITSDGERLFFPNVLREDPHRGLDSLTRSFCVNANGTYEERPRPLEALAELPTEAEDEKLYFRLDKDGNGMWDNTTRLEDTGKVFSEGTRVTYVRRRPEELKQFQPSGWAGPSSSNDVAMYHVSGNPCVTALRLPDGFDAFAFRVKAV